MFLNAIFSELSHRAQYQNSIAILNFSEIFYGSLHTAWICIIGIEDNFICSSLNQLRATVRWQIIFQCISYLFEGNFKSFTDRYGSEYIGQIIITDEVCPKATHFLT